MKLTAQDLRILSALSHFPHGGRSYPVAQMAGLRTSSIKETGARHLIKLTKEGLAEHVGTRMFPIWRITEAGRRALARPTERKGTGHE